MIGLVRVLAITLALALGVAARAQAPATRVYMVTLAGEFGRDVAHAPMLRVARDAMKEQPDVLVVKLDCVYTPGEASEREADMAAPDQLDLARRLDDLLTDDIQKNERWDTKPRLVFWIRNAPGGAGMLAFVGPEVYYTSDGRHSAADMRGQDGKGRSLRSARAKGLAIKGGHGVELVMAMVRCDFLLSIDFVDGKARFREDAAGELVLNDGKDLLTLDADLAKRVGLSRGTADSNEQLFRLLDVDPAQATLVGEGDKILERWRGVVSRAEECVKQIRANDAKGNPKPEGTYGQRRIARHDEKAAHAKILSDLDEFHVVSASSVGPRVLELVHVIKRRIAQLEDDQNKDVPDAKPK